MTNDVSSGARLKQIIEILKKHSVITGMTPEKLCLIIEDLGPTFVKLGQIMSMRPDMIPVRYCEKLQSLRTSAAPMDEQEVRRVVEASVQMPLEKTFKSFDFTPLGSASIAQAHKATLPTGEKVVVKVQREGIRDKMKSDIALLKKAASLLKYTPTGEAVDFNMVLDEMWVVSQEEMNFIIEAQNIEEFRRLNAEVEYVSCPKVYREYCTEHILVMEQIDGIKIDEVDKLKNCSCDLDEMAKKLCDNYMKQVLDDGFFHADPHPGNIFVRDGKIVWIDLGMMGRLSPRDQSIFKKIAGCAVSRDTRGLMEAILQIGKHTKPINREKLYSDVDDMANEYMQMDMADMNLGQIAQQILELAKKHKISMPSGVTMLSRGLMTIQGVVADISPAVNMMSILSQRFARETFKNIDWKKTAALDLKALYESAQKSLSIPALISDTLGAMQKGEFKVRVEETRDAERERAHGRHLSEAATVAVICSGFLGSSIMCLSQIEPRIAGVPWIALAGFAATGAFAILKLIEEKKRK